MVWIVLGVLLVLLAAAARVHHTLGVRREKELEDVDRFRIGRKVADEEVTVFGEQLAELHIDTLTTELDPAMRDDYQAALDAYERSKQQLASATAVGDVSALLTTLANGRFARACVLARKDGAELPTRRELCFFNPQHGPAATDVAWTPSGGVEREVPVCRSDANRLANGQLPLVRVVATTGGLLPWYAAGPWIEGAAGATRAHVAGGSTPYSLRHRGEAEVRRGASGANSPGRM